MEPKTESSGKLIYSLNALNVPFPVGISQEIFLPALLLYHGDG